MPPSLRTTRANKTKKAHLNRPYWLTSRFYDDLWPQPPPAWRAARMKLLGPVLKRSHTICELGCGTGTHAIEHARRGLSVIATDFSPDMCRITREKARRSRVALDVRQADARSLSLSKPVDLITSEWGPINHLRRRSDLSAVFRSASRALKPGGHLYFDLHQQTYFESWAEPTVYEHRRFFLARQGGYLASLRRGWMEFTFFIPAQRGLLKRHVDQLWLVHWPHKEVLRKLRAAGFRSVRSFHFTDLARRPRSTPNSRDLRIMYMAQK